MGNTISDQQPETLKLSHSKLKELQEKINGLDRTSVDLMETIDEMMANVTVLKENLRSTEQNEHLQETKTSWDACLQSVLEFFISTESSLSDVQSKTINVIGEFLKFSRQTVSESLKTSEIIFKFDSYKTRDQNIQLKDIMSSSSDRLQILQNRLSTYMKQEGILKKTITTLENRNKGLSLHCEENDTLLKTIQQKYVSENFELKEQLNALSNEKEHNITETAKLHDLQKQNMSEIKLLEKEKHDIKNENTSLHQEMNNIKLQNSELHKQIEEMKTLLNETTVIKHKFETKNVKLITKCSQLKEKLDEVNKEKTFIINTREKINQVLVESNEKDANDAEKYIKQLEKEKEILQTSNNELNLKLVTTEKAKNVTIREMEVKLHDSIEKREHEKEVHLLQQSIKQKDDRLEEFQQNVSSLEKSTDIIISKYKKENEESAKEIAELKLEIKDKERVLQSLQRDMSNKEQINKELKDNIKEMSDQNFNEKERFKSKYKQRKDELISEYSRRIDHAEGSVKHMQAVIKEKDIIIQTKKEELEQKTNQYTEIKESNKRNEIRIHELQNEKETLQVQLRQVNGQLTNETNSFKEQLENIILQFKTEKEDMRLEKHKSIQNSKMEKDVIDKEKEILKKEFSDSKIQYEKQVRELERTIKALQENQNRLQEDNDELKDTVVNETKRYGERIENLMTISTKEKEDLRSEKQKEIKNFENEIADLKSIVEENNQMHAAKIASLEQERDKILLKAKEDNDLLDKRLKEAVVTISDLKQVQDVLTDCRREKADLEAEKKTLIEKGESENQRLGLQIREKDKLINNYISDHETLISKIKNFETMLNDKDLKVEKLQTDASVLKKNEEGMICELNELRKEKATLTNQCVERMETVCQLKKENEKIISDRKSENERLQRQMDLLLNEKKELEFKLEQQLKNKDRKLAEIEGLRKQSEEQFEQLKKQSQRDTQRLEELDKQADVARQENNKLKARLRDYEQLLTLNERLRTELADLKAKRTLSVQLYSPSRGDLLSGVEEELIAMLKRKIETDRLKLEFIACAKQSDIQPNAPTVMHCVTVSRLGTDVANVAQGITLTSKMALLVIHHKDQHALPSQTSDRVLTGNALGELGGIFDMAFLTGKGFYSCQMNTNNIISLVNFLKREGKLEVSS